MSPRIDLPFPPHRTHNRKVLLDAFLRSQETGMLGRVKDIWIPSGFPRPMDLKRQKNYDAASIFQVLYFFLIHNFFHGYLFRIDCCSCCFFKPDFSLFLKEIFGTHGHHQNFSSKKILSGRGTMKNDLGRGTVFLSQGMGRDGVERKKNPKTSSLANNSSKN